MKSAFVLTLIALAGCSSRSELRCPSIEILSQRDAAKDARAAIAKGDNRLLLLGGFVGQVPGVPNADNDSTRMIEGTSDTATEACMRQRGIAEAYAKKYNLTIVMGAKR